MIIKQLKELLMTEKASYINTEFLGHKYMDKFWTINVRAEAGMGTMELNKIILNKRKRFY